MHPGARNRARVLGASSRLRVQGICTRWLEGTELWTAAIVARLRAIFWARCVLVPLVLLLLSTAAQAKEPEPVYLALEPNPELWQATAPSSPEVERWTHSSLDLSVGILVVDSGDCARSPEAARQTWLEEFLRIAPPIELRLQDTRQHAALEGDWIELVHVSDAETRMALIFAPRVEQFSSNSCPRLAYFVFAEGPDTQQAHDDAEAALLTLHRVSR